jgi:hypothetical protein
MLAPLDRAAAWRLLAPSARLVVASARDGAGIGVPRWDAASPATLLALASHERCEAALLALADRSPAGAVDPALLAGLRQRARVAGFRAAGLADGAEAALDALERASVPAVWLKGAGLALAHGDEGFAVRPMGDIDLLVATDDLADAAHALEGAGWTATADAKAYAVAHHHLAPFRWRGDPLVRLELHHGVWTPGHPFPAVEPADWLAASRAVAWRGRRARVPAPAWGLAHAAAHWAWSHEGTTGTWQWLRDVATLGPQVTLAELDHAVRVLGVARPAGWALRVASLFGVLPPALEAATAWRGRLSAGLAGMAERQWVLRAFAAGAATPGVAWDRWWWRRAMGGLGDPTQAWPWTLGVGPVAERGRSGAQVAVRLARWRGYVARLARGTEGG